jgi:hypothetical protein
LLRPSVFLFNVVSCLQNIFMSWDLQCDDPGIVAHGFWHASKVMTLAKNLQKPSRYMLPQKDKNSSSLGITWQVIAWVPKIDTSPSTLHLMRKCCPVSCCPRLSSLVESEVGVSCFASLATRRGVWPSVAWACQQYPTIIACCGWMWQDTKQTSQKNKQFKKHASNTALC